MYSAGCNKIIKQQKAVLVESGKDVLANMGWDAVSNRLRPEGQRLIFPELNKQESAIVQYLQKLSRKVHFDEMSPGTGISAGTVRQVLLNLEFMGVVASLPGNSYELS